MKAQAYALPETVVFKWDDWPPEEEGSIVQFRLVYRGVIKSGQSKGGAQHKHAVRRYFHPQIRELWNTHPGLSEQAKDRTKLERYFYNRDDFHFLSLIGSRPGRTVGCRLNILFLRRGLPGDILGPGRHNHGDIDNRVKVLLDGLKIPKEAGDLRREDGEPKGDWAKPLPDEDPFFCLLENDNLVTEISVTADRLLVPRHLCPCPCCECEGRDTNNENYVEVVVEVESFVMDDGPYPFARLSP